MMPSPHSPESSGVRESRRSEPVRDRLNLWRLLVMFSRSYLEQRMQQLQGGRVTGNAD